MTSSATRRRCSKTLGTTTYGSFGPAYQRIKIAKRSGLTTVASNVSAVSGEFEQVTVSTMHLPDGSLLYIIGVAPQEESGTYRNAFNRVVESLYIVD